MSMTTELIDRLRQHADTFAKSGFAVDGLVKDYREAADTIQLLSEKLHTSQMERSSQYYNDGWIPVEERFPLLRGAYKISNDVIITNGFEIYMGYLVERKGKIFWHYYGSDIEVGIKDDDNDVTAWMPLPKPYQPKDGE